MYSSKYLRQTVIISEYLTPEINSIFNKYMCNIAGKLKIKQHYSGAMINITLQVKQVISVSNFIFY